MKWNLRAGFFHLETKIIALLNRYSRFPQGISPPLSHTSNSSLIFCRKSTRATLRRATSFVSFQISHSLGLGFLTRESTSQNVSSTIIWDPLTQARPRTLLKSSEGQKQAATSLLCVSWPWKCTPRCPRATKTQTVASGWTALSATSKQDLCVRIMEVQLTRRAPLR